MIGWSASRAGDGLPRAEGVAGEVGGGVSAVDDAGAPADLVEVQVRPGQQELERVRGVAVAELGGAVEGEPATGGEYRDDLDVADRPVDHAAVVGGHADGPRQAPQRDRDG